MARLLTEISRSLGDRLETPEEQLAGRIDDLERELAGLRATTAFRLREWILASPVRRTLFRPALAAFRPRPR